MRKFLISLAIFLVFSQITKAQMITCLPCDQLGMSVNVGSDTNTILLYHAGQYLTHPQAYNIFSWKVTDMQGNIISQDSVVNSSGYYFYHNTPLTDTMNVTVYLRNDSAILPNGNSINCFFEDQIYWEVGVWPTGAAWGSWEFIYGNVGSDVTTLGINNYNPTNKLIDGRIYDLFGRVLKEIPVGQMYIQNGKKFIKSNN